jgi:phosphohistidine phosphatase
MRQIAKALRNLGVEFDLILSSPYVRACETSEILADVYKMKKKLVFNDNLSPLGDPELLIGEINEKYSVDSLAVVGHEPYLSTLIGLLVAENAKIDITLKRAGSAISRQTICIT